MKSSFIPYIVIAILIVLLMFREEPTTIIKTEKEIIVQDHRDTVFKEIEVIKWKTEKVYETIIQLDTIRDTTILVETQKGVIHDLVDINKDKDTTINRLIVMDSLNQEVIQDLKVEQLSDKKKINNRNKVIKAGGLIGGLLLIRESVKLAIKNIIK